MAITRTQRRIGRIALDVTLLVGFIAEFVTREGPDYAVHSWIGVALIGIVAFHLSLNWSWVKSTFQRRSDHPEWALARFNAIFSIVTVVCIITGFPLWLEWSEAGALSAAHTITGFVSILMALSHLWRNRSRVRTLLRRRTAAA